MSRQMIGPRSCIWALVCLATLPLAASRSGTAHAAQLTSSDIVQLNQDAADPVKARDVVLSLRAALTTGLDSTYAGFARQTIVRALIVSQAPAEEILGAADTAERFVGKDAQAQAIFHGTIAQALTGRRIAPEQAALHARKALAACPQDARFANMRSVCRAFLGQAQILLSDGKGAVESLRASLAEASDSQFVLYHLGNAYTLNQQPELAIDAYVRSLGVFAATDTSAAVPLRALYFARKGDYAEMNSRIEAARAASRKLIALDGRKFDGIAPTWQLPDLAGKARSSSEFKGKVVVLDFWGSWCGPCRMELPIFQAMYERFRKRGVVFVGINWEREDTDAKRLKAAKEYVESSKYSFPVVLDHKRDAVTSYAIDAFPTMYLIDKSGKFRYRNVGVSPGIEAILAAQIESLID